MITLAMLALAAACEPVPGTEPLLRPGAILLLGEIHGTEESPAVVSKLACLGLERGLDVTVGLEIPVAENERLERYLAGGAVSELLAGPFWARDYQDGRSSSAMLELVTRLRELSAEANLDVLLIDDPEAEGGRDRFMAARVAERARSEPEGLVIALVGNLHNRLVVGSRFDPAYEPMGWRLTELVPERPVTSLQITHGGGSAWVCTGSEVGDCGSRELNGRDGAPGLELYPEDDPEQAAFSGRYHLERITASAPATSGN